MRNLFLALCLTFAPVTALAQEAGSPAPSATSPDDLGKFLAETLAAASAKDWRVFASLLLIGAVWAMRKFAGKIPGKFGAFWSTDRGGAVMALVAGVLGSVAHVLAAKASFSWAMLSDGVVMAVTAAGGWAVMKKLVSPSDAAK